MIYWLTITDEVVRGDLRYGHYFGAQRNLGMTQTSLTQPSD